MDMYVHDVVNLFIDRQIEVFSVIPDDIHDGCHI